jgi:hypothetical protein
MNLNQIIEEVYSSGSGNFPAYSSPPRKDFAPMSGRGGFHNAYQQNAVYDVLTEPQPESPLSMPWPLQTVGTDIADSFVYLMAGMSKIVQCLKENPSLDKESKKELVEIYKKSKQALSLLKDVGVDITKLNMSDKQPPQNPIPRTPDQRIDPKSLPNPSPMIAIKLPK